MGVVRRIRLAEIRFANGFVFALPTGFLDGLPDEFCALLLSGRCKLI